MKSISIVPFFFTNELKILAQEHSCDDAGGNIDENDRPEDAFE
jgi:hypothetical protein